MPLRDRVQASFGVSLEESFRLEAVQMREMLLLVREQVDVEQPSEITLERLSIQMRQLYIRDQILPLVEASPEKVLASTGDGVERGRFAEPVADHRRLRDAAWS